MRIVQFCGRDEARRVGIVSEDSRQLEVVRGATRLYDLAQEALRSGTRLEALIESRRSGRSESYDEAIAEKPDLGRLHYVRGNVLTHIFNGHLMAQAVDDDTANRALGGLLGFQMHVGPPMKLELRNIWLKIL